ncbi:Ig-like domain-containing protein [Aquimarina sp. 2304DJ70-9]|uniref:Ig-like domain-containing protein n=1 Tax=Aquimarina penaris TaxID=3231044 RepID=UPI00346376AD
MKRLLLLVFVFFISSINAQFNTDAPWMNTIQAKKSKNYQPTFKEIQNAFNQYWETRDPNKKGSGYKPFKRWEYIWESVADAEGHLPTTKDKWTAWENKTSAQKALDVVDLSDWEALGPYSHTNTGSWSSGQARINVIYIDPNTSSTWYVGTPAGGLWKSIDSGTNWVPLTDNLPQIGVSGIAVDYSNSNIIYIATGDDDAGDTQSAGVFKSTDGGLTWNPTGLNPDFTPSSMNEIYMHPTNSNILWVATNAGVLKTTDAGVTWDITLSGNIKDLKLKPGDPNTIYAVTPNQFFKSENGGNSFTQVTNGVPTNGGRMVIDVTPANANYVYILSANADQSFQGVYQSTDSGASFLIRDANVDPTLDPNILESTQAYYDLALGVSTTNADEIYVGCLNVWKSSDGGTNFTKVNEWNNPTGASYTHADIHMIRSFNGAIFVCSDGGIYYSTDSGVNFTDYTAGIQASQFYKIAVSPKNANKMMGGLQDNGGHAYNAGNGNWLNYYGADGMDTAIDPVNDDQYYGFIQFGGALFISNNAGSNLTNWIDQPTNSNGNWVTPLTTNSTGQIYAAYDRLYRVNDTEDGWISLAYLESSADQIEIAPSDDNRIYIAAAGVLKRSNDAGKTVSDIYTFGTIKGIAVHSTNPDIVWVTTNNKVFRSNDGGSNFNDITSNLPVNDNYFFLNDIVHQAENEQNPIYVATSIGVYRNVDDGSWTPFFNNLPTTIVNDLEINILDNSITAATYGRGIWRSSLPTCTTLTAKQEASIDGSSSQNVSSILELCTGQSAKLNLNVTSGSNPTYNWTGPNGFSSTNASISFDNLTLNQAGTYTVILEAPSTCGSAEYTFSIDVEQEGVQPKSNDLTDICSEESVILTATGSSLGYRWYDTDTGGTLLATGSSFTTPPLLEDATYYVAGASSPIVTEDISSPGVNTATDFNFSQGLVFNTNDDIVLESFTVSAVSAGNRTIAVQDELGNIVVSTSIDIPEGESRVTVNFDIPRGKNYTIFIAGNLIEMRRTPSGNGVSYPYTSASNIVSIIGNTVNNPDFYYFFYDWTFTSKGGRCESVRTAVNIDVNKNDISETTMYVIDDNEGIPLNNEDTIIITEGSNLALNLIGSTFDGTLTWTSPTNEVITGNTISFENIKNNDSEEGNWSVTADFASDCGPKTQTIAFNVKVKANNPEDIVMSPNPASDIITINSNDDFENTTILIFDIQGREISNIVHVNQVYSDEIKLDISSLANGSYFVKIETNQKRLTKRILKQ